MTGVADFKKLYQKLNTNQKKAVDTIEGPVIVLAGPGTGKTQVLTMRIANILLKTGVKSFGGISGQKAKIFEELTRAAINPFIIFGLGLYGLSFVIWLRVLTFNDLSRAYPIFATIVFMLTTIGSVIFLKTMS